MKMTAPQSLKFAKLKRRLALPHWQVVGLLESIWLFTQVNAPAGDIGRHTDEDIASGIEWAGDATALIEALVECRWLDRSEEHRLLVHDWQDHVPKYLAGAMAKNGKAFAGGKTKQPAKPRKQTAKTAEQPANSPKHDAPRLGESGLGNSNHTNHTDAFASEGVRRGSKSKSKTKTSTDPLFGRFWEAYPWKVSRAKAARAFAKLNLSEDRLDELLAIIERQKVTGCLQPKKDDDGRLVMLYPATWINDERWEDENPKPSVPTAIPASQSNSEPLSEDVKSKLRSLDHASKVGMAS